MDEVEIDPVLRPWGNSYGVVIPADVVRRLHAKPGQPLHLKVTFTARNDASRLPKWRLPVDFDIDELVDEDVMEDHGRL